MSHLRLVTDELQEIAAANRAADEEAIGQAVIDADPELVDLPQTKTKADDPDVLGLSAATIWAIADMANVSRGKVRRVLAAFEPAFWQRLDEAYKIGHGDGQVAILMQLEDAANEHSDDPEGPEGREEGVSPEA